MDGALRWVAASNQVYVKTSIWFVQWDLLKQCGKVWWQETGVCDLGVRDGEGDCVVCAGGPAFVRVP